jgi:predicted dehydrogenase
MSNDHSIVRIGVIGLGEIAQVSHINLLLNLPHLFKITFLCDVSEQLLSHLARKVPHAKLTKDAYELCSSDDVDAVLICSATPFHPEQCISALGRGKWVLVEKPIAVCYRDLDAIIEAEKTAGGAKVFVGYQRRYAEALADAIEEVKGCKIDYMRVRGQSVL